MFSALRLAHHALKLEGSGLGSNLLLLPLQNFSGVFLSSQALHPQAPSPSYLSWEAARQSGPGHRGVPKALSNKVSWLEELRLQGSGTLLYMYISIIYIRKYFPLGGVFFGALFFFWCPFFFFVGGWCRLERCHFCKLWREKTRISAKFRVLQPNTAQHSFWGLGFCNPTLLLGL